MLRVAWALSPSLSVMVAVSVTRLSEVSVVDIVRIGRVGMHHRADLVERDVAVGGRR